MVPILRELDESEAERLEGELPSVKAVLGTLPNGLQSLEPTLQDTPVMPGQEPTPINAVIGPKDSLSPVLQEEAVGEAYASQVSQIVRMAEEDPKQAISSATILPILNGSTAPRLQALTAISEIVMRKHPSASRQAIKELQKALSTLEVEEAERHFRVTDYWIKGIETAINSGAFDLAADMLDEAVNFAQKLEKEDSNSDDPNTAFQGWWPSTVLTSRLALVALRISPDSALRAINNISDPVLKLVSQITVANAALGVPTGSSTVMVKKKNTGWAQYGGPDT